MEPVVTRRVKVLLVVSSIASVIYLGWRIFFTIPVEYGLISLIAGIALVVAETIGVIEAFAHYANLRGREVPNLPVIPESWYPSVDVYVTTHDESVDLLYATLNGCKHLKYPDLTKVHIYLCDDMMRPEMRDLAAKMGVGYFGLKDNKYAKAGNLNNAIAQTDAELLVTFDADMIPMSEFLLETVPYMFLPRMIQDEDGVWRERTADEIDPDYKMGFVQTPQSFYNADLFQFNLFAELNIPNEQDYFFQKVNIGRNRSNSTIYAGSNTVLSRAALAEAGGIVEGNITEDFATGINIQAKGYRSLGISKVFAHGLAPSDFKSLIRQRQRWARGCVQTVRKSNFLFGPLPFPTKMSYVSSFLYWWTFMRRLIYIISPILFVVFGIVVVDTSVTELLLIWLPSYLLYNRTLKVLSGKVRTQNWSNIIDTILFPYMIGPVLAETVGIKLKKFHVTAKEHTLVKSASLLYALPHILLLLPTVLGIYMCSDAIFSRGSYGSLIVLFWLVMNGYFLIMAIAFYAGRVNYRSSERYYARIDVDIKVADSVYRLKTSDISATGLAVKADTAYFIPPDEAIEITAYYNDYVANFKARVVHVAEVEGGWRYAIDITEIDDKNKAEYYQIIYDRDHTLAKQIKSLVPEDVATVVKGVLVPASPDARKLPRLNVNVQVGVGAHAEATIEDYNYQYVTVRGVEAEPGEVLTFNLGEGQSMSCVVDRKLSEGTYLCEVGDWKRVARDSAVQAKLLGITASQKPEVAEVG